MLDGNLTLGIIIAAGLADSINPCVLGVLIFLLAFLTRVFKNRNRMLLGGLMYSLIVYATYLALGFGILKGVHSVGLAHAFYWIAAVIAILVGLIEIKDYFWYGKGFTLQMMPGGAQRLKYYTTKIENLQRKHPVFGLFLVGLLGIFVVLIELPCTGAPYFAVLALLAEGAYAQAIPYLLLYNFIFVLPLLVVIGVAYIGKGEKMEEWRKHYRGLMRLLIGIFLIALGGYMIYSII